MNLLDSIRDLYQHIEWADARMWREFHKTPDAADDAIVRDLIHHIHFVQRAFLSVWNGDFVMPPEIEEFASFDDVETWSRGWYDEARAFIATLDEAKLDTPIVLPWANRMPRGPAVPGVPMLGETLMQVSMHSVHHRAQVMSRLRQLGGDPQLVDFIAWIWANKEAPDWT